MLTFYHAPNSRSGRTMWLLEEAGLGYRTHYVSIRYGDGSGVPDASNVHPDGKVPAIVVDGILITESHAIALYIADLVPELGAPVGSVERGPFLAWLAWAASELEPTIFAKLYGGGDDPRIAQSFAQVVARIDAALAKGPYLMGDRFTAIDVMIGGSLAWAHQVMPESAVLDAYLERISERPAHRAACAKDAPLAVAA